MSRIPYNYYDELRRNDEIINESKEVSSFHQFAKQFQPKYETEKRHADYERFFNDRATENTLEVKLHRIIQKGAKKRGESKTIVR